MIAQLISRPRALVDRPRADHRAVFRQFARRLAKAVRSKTVTARAQRKTKRRRRHAR